MQTLARVLFTLLALQIVPCVEAQDETWTFRITFAGAVDLISDGSDTPDEVWLLVPDLGTPSTLPLPPEIKQDINSHRSRLYFYSQDGTYLGEGDPGEDRPCHRPGNADKLSFLELDDPKPVQIEISTFTELPLKLRRLRVPSGGVPCIPGIGTCDAQHPIWEQIRSTTWIANIDQVLEETLGKVMPLRSGLLSKPFYSGSLLDARVWIDSGTGETGSLWRKTTSMDFQEVYFQANTAGSQTTPRALTRTLSFSYELALGQNVRLSLLPLSGEGDHQHVVLNNNAKPIVEVFVVNEPAVDCMPGMNDFLGHLVLREGSNSMEDWPLMKTYLPPPPASDPQCSPAENGG